MLTAPYSGPDHRFRLSRRVARKSCIGSLFTHLNDEGYNHEGWGFFLAYAPQALRLVGDVGRNLCARSRRLRVWLALGADAARLFAPIQRPRAVRKQKMAPLANAGQCCAVAPDDRTFLLLISPHYPWYYAAAVPLLTVCLYPPLLWVTLVVSASTSRSTTSG